MQENRNRRKTGADYERAAGFYPEQEGWKILEYNYRTRNGEIDIVARDGEYLVFCEVKYRSDGKKAARSRQWTRGNSSGSVGLRCTI
mgnify:CR=1 FL=1